MKKAITLICLLFSFSAAFSQWTTLQDQYNHFKTNLRMYDSTINLAYTLRKNIHTPDLRKAISGYDSMIAWEKEYINKFGRDKEAFERLYEESRRNQDESDVTLKRLDQLNSDMASNVRGYSLIVISALQNASYSDNRTNKELQDNSKTAFKDRGSSLINGHTGLNASLGLPFLGIPMYESDVVNQSVSSNKTSELACVGLSLSLNYHVYRNNNVDIQILGGGEYANSQFINDLLTTSDGSSAGGGGSIYYGYNYGGQIDVGSRQFKLFGQYLGGYRNISFAYTLDLTGYGGTSSVQSASAAYNFSRMSGGLKFDFSDTEEERFLKIQYSLESPDYASSKNYWGAGLHFRDFLDLSATFFPDYPAAGHPNYSVKNPSAKTSFWSVTLGKAWDIF